MFKKILFLIFACISGSILAQTSETFPNKPVKIVIPFPPGGGIDVLVRAIGIELSEKWKQAVIIENKGGAATFIGAEAVARSAPDGYTLLATTDPTLTSNRHLFKQMPYDPDKSFSPIMQMVKGDNLILANPTVPVGNLKELIALSKREPGKLNYGSYGNGTQPQLVFSYLNSREGIDIAHIPYKGISPAMLALVGGEVGLSVASAGVAGEMLKSGKLKALAVTGVKRLAQFSDIPTTAELGFPYLRSFIWYGLLAPAGTPKPIINKINTDVRAILTRPDFAERHASSKGMSVIASTPEAMAQAIKDDSAVIGEMIKIAGVKAE
jgi:tripartite-type tricarboxylate transporter receptor subunit TctC